MAQQQAQPQQPTGAVGSMPDAKTPDEKTFVGKITKSGNDLVFKDSVGESTYQLDDQTKAQPFVGKNVMVTGTVDEPTKTIHVLRIKPES
jgi:hypothetical protein